MAEGLVIIPTYNEIENIEAIVTRKQLERVLEQMKYAWLSSRLPKRYSDGA